MLKVENLSYSLGNKTIIQNINFSAEEKDSISVIGPNGAGKSTLIRLLDGLIQPTEGSITLWGKNITSYKRKELAKIISYVPQNSGLAFDFTAEEFVSAGRYPYADFFGNIGKNDQKIIKDSMEAAGVYKFKDRPLGKMSGGERQRVFIAAALAQNAPIMLLDEPTVYLDPKSAVEINALMASLNKQKGITMITVTHDINFCLLAETKLLGIKNGKQQFWTDGINAHKNKYFDDLFDTNFIYLHGADHKPQILSGAII